MATIQRTAQAEEDLIELWLYIAQDNPPAADRVLDDIEAGFQHLAINPLMGRLRPDIAPELRYFVVGKYLI
ncbi:MAG TPA: type II toxin-antitoxin system RelE/ParE family toxin, partial [Nitrosomonas sp.]|nr:type II toxin-antitoxin system RelE/ParE family toxin [Nitrosomonas sp.]